MRNTSIKDLPDNFSRLIIPFYMKDKNGKKGRALFLSEDCWMRVDRGSVYLTGYMNEVFGGEAGDICGFFMLKEEAREKVGLPQRDTLIHVISEIRRGITEEFSFKLEYIWAAYFATGMGFLCIDIGHDGQESVKEITDKCFALVNCFNERIDKNTGRKVVRFHYHKVETIAEFEFITAIKSILGVDKDNDELKFFPTNMRSKLNAYHRLFRDNVSDDDVKYADCLAKGMHSAAILLDSDGLFESEFRYKTNNNTRWNINSVAAVALVENEPESNTALLGAHLGHIENDYFLVYLFGLYKREILLWYNYQIVSNWNDADELIKLKDELIRFNVWFSYNTVSCEMTYQNYYESIYKVLKLEKLENDVQEVVAKVSEYESGIKSARLGGFMTMITIITTVSVFGEIIDFVRWIMKDETSRLAENIGVIIVIVAVIIAIIYIVLREKGKRMRKNKWMRRKKQR